MYNTNKMNKRVVGLDEFRVGMSPHEEEILEGFASEVEFFKSFGRDKQMKSSSKSSSRGRRLEKKTKVLWTKDLHNKFVEAVGKLGIDKAVPKKIVELMNVDGLTRDHVASHLQKYRILSKRIANANYGVQNATNLSLLESSLTDGDSWSHYSSFHNQDQTIFPSYSGMHAINPLILDTSSSYFPVRKASNSNNMYKGNSMQAVTKNLDERRNFIDYSTNLSVMNSVNISNSGSMQNLDHAGLFHDYGGCSTEVQMLNNFDKGSSGDVQYCSKSFFAQNLNSTQRNYSSQNEFVEMSSSYGADSNRNFANRIGEDDIVLSEVDIAHLLSFVDDNNHPVTLDPSFQDVNVQNSPNMCSFYSNHDQEQTSINQQQTLDAYLPGFEPTFDEQTDEQFLETVWSPDLLQAVRQFPV